MHDPVAQMKKVNKALINLARKLEAYNNRQKKLAAAATLMRMSRSPRPRSKK